MRYLSAIALLVFMSMGLVVSLWLMPPLNGFTEKSYNEALPMYQFARNFWGRAEYALFAQGRGGVVVGQDGRLYTAEEFTCPRGWQQNLAQNMAYIREVQAQMAARQVELRIVIIPAKARLLQAAAMPSCRRDLYDVAQQASGSNINLLADMQAQLGQKLFFDTDTHWTPLGADLAARRIARTVAKLQRTRQEAVAAEVVRHRGDLARYLPGVDLPAESISRQVVVAQAVGLLDDAEPPALLIGTSYSANPLWGFEDSLRLALQADVQNLADEGQGPFAVMRQYLASESWQTTPPQNFLKVVVWEIPERYLVLDP